MRSQKKKKTIKGHEICVDTMIDINFIGICDTFFDILNNNKKYNEFYLIPFPYTYSQLFKSPS